MRFVLAAEAGSVPFRRLCRQFGISRQTGYAWRRRHALGGLAALQAPVRRPRAPGPLTRRWQRRLRALRRRYPCWGAPKLHALLGRRFGQRGLPVARTLGRWLRAWGWSRPRARRRFGPAEPRSALTVPRRPNEVWTVDFKGWFRTRDGRRCCPLTVRDLHSRYLLVLAACAQQREQDVAGLVRRTCQRCGVPAVIRVDNGGPFAGDGARGLSRLSVAWLRQGIRVEFTRPARPGDNAAQEQLHRVLADELVRQADRATQQRWFERWQRRYNTQRPHAALAQEPPAWHYRRGRRRWQRCGCTWTYPRDWSVAHVGSKGRLHWAGRQRNLGRAFAGERVGLRPRDAWSWEVYLGPWLLGTLHLKGHPHLRPVRAHG